MLAFRRLLFITWVNEDACNEMNWSEKWRRVEGSKGRGKTVKEEGKENSKGKEKTT